MVSRAPTLLRALLLFSTACASNSGPDTAVAPTSDVTVAPQAAPSTTAQASSAQEGKLGGDPRKRECDQLIEAVNASTIGESVAGGPKGLALESQEAIRLRDKIGKLAVTDVELAKLVKDYRDNLTDYAAMIKRAAEVDPNDADGLMKLVQSASEVAARNSELTQKVSEYCKP